MSPITPPGRTRKRVLEYVRQRILEGNSPTIREVQREFGFRAVESARAHLEALVNEGLLVKPPGRRSRGYRLPAGTGLIPPPAFVPLIGRVQAGALSAALEDPEGYLAIQTRKAESDDLFALRVKGESMRDAGIFDGDVVVVRRQPSANSGEIVVAMIEDEATVKRLRMRRRRVELLPENEEFSPIVPDPETLTILGKVIEVRRYLEQLPLTAIA